MMIWPLKVSIALLATLAACQVAIGDVNKTSPSPTLPGTIDVSSLRTVVVQHSGRWSPLESVAEDYVSRISGFGTRRDGDSVLLLLAWTFDPFTWQHEPLIQIRNSNLRKALALPQDQEEFSFHELARHGPLLELYRQVKRIPPGRKVNPLQSSVRKIARKLELLETVFQNQAMRFVPDANDRLGRWTPIRLHEEDAIEQARPVETAWSKMRIAFLADDGVSFRSSCDALISRLAALPSATKIDQARIDTEIRFNKIRPFRWSWIILGVATLLMALGAFLRSCRLGLVAMLACLIGFAVLTYGIVLRWNIAERFPAANMYESMLFLGWGTALAAIVSPIFLRGRLPAITAIAVSTLSLALADYLPIDSYIRPIAPVLLDTAWMAVHVPEIMVSYAVLAIAVLIAHAQIIVSAAMPSRKKLIHSIDTLHCAYLRAGILLLAIGIMTGSMWAGSSWGRYWGWDPKEVWSLVALLAYISIMHVRSDRSQIPPKMLLLAAVILSISFAAILGPFKLSPLEYVTAFVTLATVSMLFLQAKSQFATAVKSIMAFWLIIMTYIGVNYVLGIGLHSYAFGTGAVVYYMKIIAALDLLIIAICSVAYMTREDTADKSSRQ